MTQRILCGGLGALVHSLGQRAGARPVIEDIDSQPWASITFSGARHTLGLRFDGKDAAMRASAMTSGLDYAEFDLGTFILVDIDVVDQRIDSDSARLCVEALIIEAD